MNKYIIYLCLTLFSACPAYSWGFHAHRLINRLAIFTLPPELTGFYKQHHLFITENAVNPDRRRYAMDGEAPRHYIDLDEYGDSAVYKLPRHWEAAKEKYGEDSLMAYGIVPWHIHFMKYQLTEAFKKKDLRNILRLSADIGHYIADAHVPLHTTRNYNGQFTGQRGIHGFWESRLPELFAENYNYFVGKAVYEPQPQLRAWQAVTSAHLALDSVFRFEREISASVAANKKYGFEERGGATVKVYSKEFSSQYHQMLHGQVERQMRASIKMIGDFWYTCWVDAGQPDLSNMDAMPFTPEELEQLEQERQNQSGHEH